MQSRTRIDISDWESNGRAGQVLISMSSSINGGLFSTGSYNFDNRIEGINDRLGNTDFISRVPHTPINPLLNEAVTDASTIHSYIFSSLRDIDEIVDRPFFEVFNHPTGVLETLELIRLDNYQIDNNLGITTTTTHHDYMGGSHEITRVQSTIGLRDIMNNDTIEGTLGMPSFTEMFQEQFYGPQASIREGLTEIDAEIARLTREIEEHPHLADELGVELAELQAASELLTEQLESMESMDFNDYVNMLIHRADVHHTVDRGWRNGLSNVLDTVGIVSIWGAISGRNFVTGERLTPEERRSAGFTALLNVGFLALGVVTGGAGTLLAKVAINIGTSMLSGVVAMATAGILDHFGAPPWLQTVGAMAAGFATGYVSGRAIDTRQKARTANQIGEIANQNGLTVDQLNDVRRHLPSTQNLSDTDFIRLLNEKPLDDLLGLPELNRSFLSDVAGQNGLTLDELYRQLPLGDSDRTFMEFMRRNPNATIDDYFTLLTEQSPWPSGFTPVDTVLNPGETFEMAVSVGQKPETPGRFGTDVNSITDVDFVRNDLAVITDWKSDIDRVVQYSVREDVTLPVRQGPIGPQIDLSANRFLPGGANQVEIMLPRGTNLMDFLEVVDIRSIQ